MSTTLNCLQWMQNQNDQDPCRTAQAVGRLCNTQYTVSLTAFQESNYIPNATTTNGCTCSWSIYNLLSACSYCVGQTQYTSWRTWVTNCGSLASNTSYLPSGLSISPGIPFWAATNPSTWENAVFSITAAADIAAAAHPDVTGGPLPTSTSTTTSSSASGVSVGAIVGGVIGAIVIIVIGVLIIFWAMRRHRRTLVGVPAFTASQLTTVPPPSIRNRTPVQHSTFGYTCVSPEPVSPRVTSPVHSTTSLAATSLLASPVSSGFSSQTHSATPPIADAADMISPFLIMSPGRPTDRPNASLPRTGKAAEALSRRATAPLEQRARLNPPPYSASMEPALPRPATTAARRLSMKKQKKRNDSVSGSTTYSGHSRTSTRESATTVHAGPRTEQSRPRAATSGAGTAESVVSVGGVGNNEGGGNAETTHDRRADQRPPAV